MQYKINRDYKLEVLTKKFFSFTNIQFILSQVDCVQRKLEENQSEYSSRVLESGQLLDIRAERIRKLEK